ncbi:Aldo/keto reductase family protein [compost metagenome]
MPYDVALAAVEEIRSLLPGGAAMAQFALRWILMEDAVGTVIPGAKNPLQAQANARASALPALDADTMAALRSIYTQRIAPHVHERW